jgi:hypothetical protein
MNTNEKIMLEHIERIVYKNADDIVVSIARSFERLEDRMDGLEARLCERISLTKEALSFLYEVESKRLVIKPDSMSISEWSDYKATTASFQRLIQILEQ